MGTSFVVMLAGSTIALAFEAEVNAPCNYFLPFWALCTMMIGVSVCTVAEAAVHSALGIVLWLGVVVA